MGAEKIHYEVGQKIIGKQIGKGEIEEYVISRVGTRYIYVKNENFPVLEFIVHKYSLRNKEPYGVDFYHSIQEMDEHHEMLTLYREICRAFEPAYRKELSIKKLRAIKAILDEPEK